MGFDTTTLTQDTGQDLFTIKPLHHIPLAPYYDGPIMIVIHGQNMVIIFYQQQSVWCKPMCANNVFKVTFSRRFFSIGHMLANFHLSHA
jgi:hypothetical protein